jgi:hypothetical protein
MAVNILQPEKAKLLWKMGQLSQIRFKYKGKIYETYEPYFLISMIAKRENMLIKNLLFLELLKSRKLGSSKNNAQ